MTREEVIDRLKRIAKKAVHTPGETPFVMSIDDGIAIHMAISALQQPEIARELTNMWDQEDGCNLDKTTIKIRYIALLEVEDEMVPDDTGLTIDEIRQNFQSGMVEDGLKDLIAKGFRDPKIAITPQLVDVIEVKEQ